MACLIKQYVDNFLNALRSGKINPESLSSMSSENRRNFLAKYIGEENAKWANAEFESKLLLKNQQKGMITWAKKLAGLSETVRGDIVKKIERLETALAPETEDAFLSDIVERRLGVSVTAEEAKNIMDLTKNLQKHDKGTKEYGEAKQKLVKFMREHLPEEKINVAADVLSVWRSWKTSFDIGASLRQGAALFGTKEWFKAFSNQFKYIKSETGIDELEAEIYSSKYIDSILKVKKYLGLTLLGEKMTQKEEQFASKFVEKIPGVKQSARAYEGFLNDLRFNRFVNIMEELDKAGKSIEGNIPAMEELAQVIGAATGRGHLGKFETMGGPLSTVLFSPRWIASRIQLVTNPLTKSGVARKEAFKSIGRIAGIAVSLLGLAKLSGSDVEDDPRSADFGKIKQGNTRFDVTGGLGAYITLLSRIITGSKKSSKTGKITELNTGTFGSQTIVDLLQSFIENKTSPFARVILDFAKGQTIEGQPLNFKRPSKELTKYFADQLLMPLISKDTIEAFREASGDNALIMGSEAFLSNLIGISTQSYQYTPYGKKWTEFKEYYGDKEYNDAVKRVQERFKSEMAKLFKDPKFNSAPETGKNSKAEMIEQAQHRAQLPENIKYKVQKYKNLHNIKDE